MHDYNLPVKGSASPELMSKAHAQWMECAAQSRIDLTGFDPNASLSARISWALSVGLIIAAIYTRFSTKRQGSTEDQIRCTIEFGARNKMYCPPEFLCVDEAKKGRKDRRDAFERLKFILKQQYATCLLIFKLSRLFRMAYKSVAFINEELVEEGLRAVAVSQGVDTVNRKAWRLQVSLHGTMDEELLVAIGDHVREGLVGLFIKGWITGAIPIGYEPKEVPGAPPTRRNLPRMMPAIKPTVAAMILQHFQWIAGGMEISEGWRRWRADGGAVDKRSEPGTMSYAAYHRMLSRPAYIGVWEFCRKRNQWMSKRDTIEQKPQPPEEIKTVRCEDLRIVPDELFWRVQEILNEKKTGTRVRRDRLHHLWDLVIGLFRCPACKGSRYHMCGAKGQYMRCKNPDCPQRVMVDRRKAVGVLCAWASGAMRQDSSFIDLILQGFSGLENVDRDGVDREIEAAERKCQSLQRRITGLEELMGAGTSDDDHRRKAQILGAQSERSAVELELSRLRQSRGGGREKPVTKEEVLQVLGRLVDLLDAAAKGELGPEVVGKAVTILERLVGGAVFVHADQRAGRKRWTVQGSFTPTLVGAVRQELGATLIPAGEKAPEVTVWFREPPRVDAIADEVRHLYEVEGLGFRLINKRLETKYGEKIGSGNCCAAYRRWYETRGLPLPERRTTMGRPRRKTG